jgi:hypothetical protein
MSQERGWRLRKSLAIISLDQMCNLGCGDGAMGSHKNPGALFVSCPS